MKSLRLCVLSTALAVFCGSAMAGSISGKVVFEGDAPPSGRPIQMSADPNCMSANAGKEVLPEFYVIGDGGGVRDVFVYIKEGLEGQSFEAPAEPVVLDQQGCVYKPHVFGVMVGQTLKIKNSDATLHNVHMFTDPESGNPESNVSTPFQGFELDKVFENPEVMITIKCDVHRWMESFCGVLPHPFFATTEADGSYTIEGVPAGKYKLAFWHKRLGEKVFDVEVGADGTVE
ncbi:MAG: hypothetical protein KC931_25855, partial [Candidatus Omnitrophica bacterium]|nr:hypothetical protein [Candidatus Omnitrophota bacterium]